jgi:hypothetical protein
MCSKFIIVRFAPGSGGKFISSLLQLSSDVNAWETDLESIKKPTTQPEIYLDFIRSKFTKNFINWLKTEPEVPYEMNWVSNRFTRGDDVAFSQAMEYLQDDHDFQKHYHNGKKIVLILNKSRIPDWLPNNSHIINLHIDSNWASKWVHRARLYKQFLKNDRGNWIIKQDHPDYCSDKRSELAKQFQNKTEFHGTTYQFLKNYIVKDDLTMLFHTPEKIIKDPSNKRHRQVFLKLSSFMTSVKLKSQLEKVFSECKITMPSDKILLPVIDYYLQLHQPLLDKIHN